jgi:hypothetical protein
MRSSQMACFFRRLALVFAVLFSSLPCRPASPHGSSPRKASGSVPVRPPGHAGTGILQRKMFFERNYGQTDSQVLYLSRGFGYSLFLTRAGATIVFSGARKKGTAAAGSDEDYFRLRFVGANPQSDVKGIEELPGKSNYFSGSDPGLWHTRIPQFAKVRYAGLYPGIDLIFYFRDGRLEYDIAAAPGANVGAIHLKVEGANAALSRDGDIVLRSGKNESVQLSRPFAYQSGGRTTVVRAGYSLHGNDLAFALSGYDRSRPLIIDPALIFSTFITSACCLEDVADMAVDSTGVYLTGMTNASSFPATANGPTPVVTGDNRTFVVKLDPTGSQIIYSTFLSSSTGASIAVDGSGSAYVSGVATVPPPSGVAPFPLTAGVFSGTVPSNATSFKVPFAAKLSVDGSQIIYSTLLLSPTLNGTPTGSPQVTPTKVAVDSQGALYITGEVVPFNPDNDTYSVWMPLPVAQGAFQPTPGTLFALKLTPSASGLAYSTYIDGTQGLNGSPGAGVTASGIAVDSNGDAFLTGTARVGFPTTPGVYEPSITSSDSEAFVMELNPTGSSPVYSTFFGSSGTTSAAIAIDPQGEAVIGGLSFGPPVRECILWRRSPSPLSMQFRVTLFQPQGTFKLH